MAVQRTTLTLAAALLLALLVGVQRADAATVLGSVDPSEPPEAFVCAVYACPAGKSVGFRQLALYGSQVVVDEPGVLVSARVNAKRIGGGDTPRIAVLKPAADDDIGVTVAGFAPVPIVSSGAEVHEVQDLHIRVESGDSIGFLLPAGQVDLGTRTRRQPDGAVQWFMEPCGPCHMDGGTGRELLFDATIEPDADEDGLGDETQDPDFGLEDEDADPLEEDEFDDWFDELERGRGRGADLDGATGACGCSISAARGTATCSSPSARPPPGVWAESSPPPPDAGTSASRGRSASARLARSARRRCV